MTKEYDVYRIILDGPREHRADGSGTRETNPLYHGDYTIEDYRADKKRTMEDLQELGGTARVSQYWSYQFEMTGSLRANPGEWERYDNARTEALERYDGPKEWPHGWSVGLIAQKHNLTVGRYYLEFYELTDPELADAMDGLIGEYAKVAAEMSAYQGKLIEALEGNDEWRGILDEINGAYRTIGWPDMAQGAEDLAELMTWRIHHIPWDWDFDRREDIGDPLALILDELRGELDHAVPTAKAWTALNDLGTEYITVRQHIEDVFHCGPIITLELIKRLAFGDNPPQIITPEIHEHINTVYREIMEAPTEKVYTITPEGQMEESEGVPHVRNIQDLPLASSIPRFLPNEYLDNSRGLAIVHHDFNSKIRETIQRTFEDDPTWKAKATVITRNGNEEEKKRIIAGLFTENEYGTPSELMMDLAIQIGAYVDKMRRDGINNPISANDLIRMFYNVPDGVDIGPEQVEAMGQMLRHLSRNWIKLDLNTNRKIAPSDRPPELKDLIGVKAQMLTFKELEYLNDDRETTTIKYLFTDVPPLWSLNKHLNLYTMTDRALIYTPEYPFDGQEWMDLDISEDVRKKILAHFRDEKLQGERKTEKMYLHRYKSLGIKKWILQRLAVSINFDRNRKVGTINLDLERAYRDTHPDEKIPNKGDGKWIRFKNNALMYLLYLMAWGYVEDYKIVSSKTIRIIYTEKAQKVIAGVVQN